MRGHVTITKIFKDGREEIVHSDPNVIVDGMGYDIAQLLTGEEFNSVENYRIGYFQVGAGNMVTLDSAKFYNLKTPLTEAEYGPETDLLISNLNQLVGDPNFVSGMPLTTTQATFADIKISERSNYSTSGFAFQFVLGPETANGLDLKEVGLFVQNPQVKTENQPLLAAYETFGPFSKDSEYSLKFDWLITPVDCPTGCDADDSYVAGTGNSKVVMVFTQIGQETSEATEWF